MSCAYNKASETLQTTTVSRDRIWRWGSIAFLAVVAVILYVFLGWQALLGYMVCILCLLLGLGLHLREVRLNQAQGTQLDFQAVLEAAPDAMVIVSRNGQIVLVNSQTENLFGYQRQELLGKSVEMLMPARFRAEHPSHRGAFFEEPHFRPMGAGLELFGEHRDGHEFPVEISLSPISTRDGVLVSSSIRDVSERKRVEYALSEKNQELQFALQAKDRFLASMSHELRTPLNAIIGFTGTLLMGLPGPLNTEQRRQLDTPY